ncbi:MAG: TetR/AcrR family transcriptional regulator [Gallionella sp.]|nr:TetR/AcrR family transcriptional regulator [Gallionella sp.]
MRTREFDTRQAIASAMEVFWRKGYKGASMTELLAAMGIGKGSFYAAFGSKHELYLQALRHFRDTGMLAQWERSYNLTTYNNLLMECDNT